MKYSKLVVFQIMVLTSSYEMSIKSKSQSWTALIDHTPSLKPTFSLKYTSDTNKPLPVQLNEKIKKYRRFLAVILNFNKMETTAVFTCKLTQERQEKEKEKKLNWRAKHGRRMPANPNPSRSRAKSSF